MEEEAAAAAEVRDMAAQGLDTNIDEPTRVLLPSGQEIEASSLTAPDLAGVQRRIKDVVRVLDDFAKLRDPSRPRKDYVAQVYYYAGCFFTIWLGVLWCGWGSCWDKQHRINDAVGEMDSHVKLRDPTRPRKDYVAQVCEQGR